MKRVLVVDDSVTIRRMVIKASRGLGNVRLQKTGSGPAGIERLALPPANLEILDLYMKDTHGFDVLVLVREKLRVRGFPVLILSARGDDDSR